MNNPLPELKYVGTCSELGDVYERVHAAPSAALDRLAASSAAAAEADGLNPPTSPRAKREWRVTKADLEAQVVAAAKFAEARAAEIADLREDVAEHDWTVARYREWLREARSEALLWKVATLGAASAFAVLAAAVFR